MKKIGIFYGSTTGNTEAAAHKIREHLGGGDLYSIAKPTVDKLIEYDVLILGSSTWGLGELQEDWESVAKQLFSLDLKNKKVALFGTGDQNSYGDTFVDAIGILYEILQNTGAGFIGRWPGDGYTFSDSRARQGDSFCGLVLDEDNQPEKTDIRIKAWVEKLKNEI